MLGDRRIRIRIRIHTSDYGSGSGSRRPKNIRIRRIRIRNSETHNRHTIHTFNHLSQSLRPALGFLLSLAQCAAGLPYRRPTRCCLSHASPYMCYAASSELRRTLYVLGRTLCATMCHAAPYVCYAAHTICATPHPICATPLMCHPLHHFMLQGGSRNNHGAKKV